MTFRGFSSKKKKKKKAANNDNNNNNKVSPWAVDLKKALANLMQIFVMDRSSCKGFFFFYVLKF